MGRYGAAWPLGGAVSSPRGRCGGRCGRKGALWGRCVVSYGALRLLGGAVGRCVSYGALWGAMGQECALWGAMARPGR